MKLELRNEKLREVRMKNYVPGVMYGRSIKSTNIKVEKQEFLNALNEYGKNMTFKVRLDGKYHNVYIKYVQSRVLKPNDILHFDLHRITATETISAMIPIELIGNEEFLSSSYFVDQTIMSVHAEFTAGHGLSSIEVDVSKLQLGDTVLVKDLKVSDKIVLKDDLESVVLTIKETTIEEEVDENEEVVEPEASIESEE